MADNLDLFVRHQVYVEGYKNGEASRGEATLDEVGAIVLMLATQLGIENLGSLTKRQLTSFVADVRSRVRTVFNKGAEITATSLEQFFRADIEVTGKVLEAAAETSIPYNTTNLSYSSVVNTPIAGVGIEPNNLAATILAAVLADIAAKIKSGWADNQSLQDFAQEIVGTRALNYRDGVIARLKRKWSTAIQTSIQHSSSMIAFKLQALVSNTYTWCSILDGRTTDICRERNGQVYAYRNGPRPPAHWNCRSFTIPVTVADLREMPTFYTWVKRQPASIQDDILGPARGRELRTGFLLAEDLPGFDRARPLTVNEYANKVDQILRKVA